ncbi:MAG: ABC transporter ATP-binding protein [Actinomycetota bacterium]
MAAVVETNGLSKRYGDVVGVADLDLAIQPGEVFGFIGPNGSGKTTTIRLLLDFIRPTSGTAAIFGLDSHRSSLEIRRRLGYVPGDLTLFDRLTADDLFTWLGRLRVRHDPGHAAELADRLMLDPSRKIGDLSTGNRQKVGLVQAFMHRPELLVLDEPTSGLDPIVRRSFQELVAEVAAEGATVFLSSHVLNEVEDVCDRVAMITDGRLRRIDEITDLRARSHRRVEVVLGGSPDLQPLDRLACVDHLAVVGDQPVTATLDVVGEIDPLIKTLGRYEIEDLLIEPKSLEDLFLERCDLPSPEAVDHGD